VVRWPHILTIHLKRFRGNGKVRNKIKIPLILLPERTGTEKYKLIATCNHYGNLDCGHYTASTLTDDGWLDRNDGKTLKLDELDESAVYILFFQRNLQ
jgi:ubiquitin C-terminal hydrolase